MKRDKNHYYLKKTVVTGSSGFIGSHLCRELVSQGAKVVALVRKHADLWRLKDILTEIELVDVDLQDSKSLRRIIGQAKPNLVFHLAIPSSLLLKNDATLQDQIEITTSHLTNLFEALDANHVKPEAFVHACSGSIYEWNEENYILNERTALKPATLRGKLKLAQRNTCLALEKAYQIPLRLARIFRAYGPMEVSTKLIVKALEAYRTKQPILLGSSKYKRDYIYIDDLVRGMLLLGSKTTGAPLELNFGGDNQYSAEEIIAHLERLLGAEIPKELNAYSKNLYDQGDVLADCSMARQTLGWEPTTTLDEGLKKTINWYQSMYTGPNPSLGPTLSGSKHAKSV